MSHRPVPAQQMIGIVSRHLGGMGFREVYRSKTGSRYLRLLPFPWHLRISDHEWSNFSKVKNPQVLRSVALSPEPTKKIHLLSVEIAVRFMATCRHRQITAGRPS